METLGTYPPRSSEHRSGIVSLPGLYLQEPKNQMRKLKKKNVTISLEKGFLEFPRTFTALKKKWTLHLI